MGTWPFYQVYQTLRRKRQLALSEGELGLGHRVEALPEGEEWSLGRKQDRQIHTHMGTPIRARCTALLAGAWERWPTRRPAEGQSIFVAWKPRQHSP